MLNLIFTLIPLVLINLNLIVIDPGHGGSDFGALDISQHIKEKDITLDFAKSLKKILFSRLGVNVILTRKEDKNLSLDERAAIANNNKADLFLSLHIGANFSLISNGVRICVLKEENNLENFNFFWKFQQIPFIKKSLKLAEILKEAFENTHIFQDIEIIRGRFYLLEAIKAPAVIIEVGFITNSYDLEKILNQKEEIISTIYFGILNFIKKNS